MSDGFTLYIKTSIMKAKPCTSPNGTPGYTVEYVDGYVSWCPKDTFEATARPLQDSDKNLVAGVSA